MHSIPVLKEPSRPRNLKNIETRHHADGFLLPGKRRLAIETLTFFFDESGPGTLDTSLGAGDATGDDVLDISRDGPELFPNPSPTGCGFIPAMVAIARADANDLLPIAAPMLILCAVTICASDTWLHRLDI
ncbi:hypothetical protein FRB90_005507 [Tulasnella sp. 427]|nr:hypothetical protein FRB90_005507 [Tulasnella sp. 427]